MNIGKFIGVGIGPGDPELLTIKAVTVLKSADVICTPRSENSEDSIAYGIISRYCEGKEILDMSFSMAPVHTDRTEFWMCHAHHIAQLCDEGKCVVFVTLGDPGLFSSFEYVVRLLRKIRPATIIDIIPGITSIAAATAIMGISLAQAEESVTIQPCSRVIGKAMLWWNQFNCIVIMKIGKRLPRLIGRLKECALIEHTTMITRAGFKDCRITYGNDLIDCTPTQGYLAIVIVRPNSIVKQKENII